MALLKFGSIITDGSGSLAGHTIQNSLGGSQLRTKPIPHGNPSPAQITIRSINQQLQAGWRALTTAQQKIWNDWPVQHGITNKSGDPHPLSGHSLWMKLNFEQLYTGQPIWHQPFGPDPSPYGPELLPDCNFYNWGKLGSPVIDSPLSFHMDVIGGVSKPILVSAGSYHCVYTVTSLSGNIRAFDDIPSRYQLFIFSLGTHTVDFSRVNVVPSSFYIRNSTGAPSQIIFSSLSLRKIL